MLNKGVIIFLNFSKSSMILGAFRLKKKMKMFEIFFFKLRPLISQSILNVLSSAFLQTSILTLCHPGFWIAINGMPIRQTDRPVLAQIYRFNKKAERKQKISNR